MFFQLAGVTQLRTPVGLPEATRLAPRLGEHTDDVLAEYDFSPDEIAALRAARALG
jgi:crotonobetainyl-CoA:carnitine CoA-transferase CaiB-like acyl-CoA transferase